MAVGYNPSGSQNTEGYGNPRFSAYGQSFRAALPELLDRPTPIGTWRNDVKGNIGGFSATSASVQALAAASDYFGDFPQSEQPTIEVPQPWERV